jgi:hypothetical protein
MGDNIQQPMQPEMHRVEDRSVPLLSVMNINIIVAGFLRFFAHKSPEPMVPINSPALDDAEAQVRLVAEIAEIASALHNAKLVVS